MKINNPEVIEKKFKCNKLVADYLIYKCHLPLLSMDKKWFYFAETPLLKESLENIPFYLKVFI